MLFRLEKVSFSYPSGNFTLKEANLVIEKGQKVAVIGPSGSGKTTFLQLLAGLLEPTSGKLFFRSQPGVRLRRPGEVVMAFQFPESSFIATTVEEEVFLTLREAGLSLERGREKLDELARTLSFDIEKVFKRSPFSLSKGEKRKLALVSLLVLRPEVIVLDEPEAGLDGKSIASFYRLLRGLSKETLILATHQIEEVFSLAEIFVYLFEGKIVFWGNKDELAQAPVELKRKIPLEFLPFELALKWKRDLKC